MHNMKETQNRKRYKQNFEREKYNIRNEAHTG